MNQASKRKLRLIVKLSTWLCHFLILLPACITSSAWQEEVPLFASQGMRKAWQYARSYDSLDAASAALSKEVLARPESLDKRLLLARLYLYQDKHSLAITEAKAVEQKQFYSVSAKLILANAAFAKGELAKARLILTALREAGQQPAGAKTYSLQIGEQLEMWNLLGGVALQEGNTEEGIGYLKRAIRLSPRYYVGHWNLGLIYLQHREFLLAQAHFEKIIAQKFKPFYGQLHLAACYAARGELSIARQMYEELEEQEADDPLLLYNSAVLLARERQFQESFERLKEYVDRTPPRQIAKQALMDLLTYLQWEDAGLQERNGAKLATFLEQLKQLAPEQAAKIMPYGKLHELYAELIFK